MNIICKIFGHTETELKSVRQVFDQWFNGYFIVLKCKRCGYRLEKYIPSEGFETKDCSLSPDCKCLNCINYENDWADR